MASNLVRMALCHFEIKPKALCVLYIFSFLLPFELLSATTSELCIESSDTSSCTCQSCGFVTASTDSHRLCVKGDIICIPSNYSKFELPNQVNSTTVETFEKLLFKYKHLYE